MQRFFYLKKTQRPPDKFEKNSSLDKLILELTGPFPGEGGIFKKMIDILEDIVEKSVSHNLD